HPHNVVLDVWLRMSLAGLLVFAWLQLAFWRAASRAYRRLRSGDNLMLALAVGAIGSMVNLLAHGLVDNAVFVNDLSLVFALLLGLAAALDLFSRDMPPQSAP